MMIEPARTDLQYLGCPQCGTRYVAREQQAAAMLKRKDRWFCCQRCNKRVRSAGLFTPEPFGAAL